MTKLKMFEVDRGNKTKKCGCCNWQVSKVYLLAETEEQADQIFNESGEEDNEPRGLCGDCMCEMLMETGYTIDNEKV